MNTWCEESEVLTHYHNAFSILFPAWESLFCSVMKAHKNSIEDKELLEAVDKFIKQETSHAKAHHKHNERIDVLDLEEFQQHRADVLSKRPLNTTLLGAMVSIEHMASSLGRDFIDRYSSETSREYKLFLWHSREEIEHKDVAFRVWKYLGKDKATLNKIAKQNFKTVVSFVLGYVWKNTDKSKPKNWLDLIRLGHRLTVSLFIPYLAIFKDSFDPAQIDDSKYGY